jgi:hypothetical protein
MRINLNRRKFILYGSFDAAIQQVASQVPNRPVRKFKNQSVSGFEDVLMSARLDVIMRARDS